jgi:predicted phage gp36 major capsid-like protein
MSKVNTLSLEALEAKKQALLEEMKRRIEAAKKAHAAEMKALQRAERQLRAKEAAELKKAENRAKILLGLIAIDLANHDSTMKAKIETHIRQFFAKSPGRADAALSGLALRVTKPDSEVWKEDL